MQQLRKGYLSILECMAVMVASALQIASLVTLLEQHAVR